MAKRLKRKFFSRNTLDVSKDLLGKFLVRDIKGKKKIGKIVETEAYLGPEDKAAHTSNKKVTKRNIIVYGEAGRVYIYLVYGMYWQLNFTTQKSGKPECILIRALEPVEGFNNLSEKEIVNIANGPGKLCRFLELDKSFYGKDLTSSNELWVEDRGEKVKKTDILESERIGIDYAGDWAKKPWRFCIRGNEFVSRR